MAKEKLKAKLLLHACCAPCLAGIPEEILNKYETTIYWFNANIYPLEEYIKRLEALIEYAKKLNLPLIIRGEYTDDHHAWLKMTQENTNDEEGGERCRKCFKYRLMNAALYAENNSFNYFATTLGASPFKNNSVIDSLGNDIAKNLDTEYLVISDSKEAYKKSIETCKKLLIYRQKYCGCEYSIKPNK
jgi:predicted adenine nucleotide alpha hydrolase (AANH) superfamily ATPase